MLRKPRLSSLFIMEKIIKNLEESQRIIRVADHLIYMTYPLVKDKKLLLKIIVELKKGLTSCINAILQYEYLYKRIKLSPDSKSNFNTFQQKCAPRYNISNQEIQAILEIFRIVEKHKQSPMEFVRNEKVVILSKNLQMEIITFEQAKQFLQISKDILKKVESVLKDKI